MTDSDSLRDRVEGRARTGFVTLRAFDEGVVETMGAKIDCELDNYFLKLEEVETVGFDPPVTSPFSQGPVRPRPGLPGIPVTFSHPEEIFEKYSIPSIVVRREGLDPATQRWHPGLLQYRAPARGALAVEGGVDRVEQVEQAVPYDLIYTIEIRARNRGGLGPWKSANRVQQHVVSIYPPYCEVRVRDSVGDIRGYEAFQEGISPLDTVADVGERVIGFSVSLRIEGEIDSRDPEIHRTALARRLRTSTRG